MNLGFQTHRRGFTLIEMMTVITIMIILTGITVGGFGFVKNKQAVSKAKIDIKLLASAIEEYKLVNGEYPGIDEDTIIDGDISEELYNDLFYFGWDSKTNGDGSIEVFLNQLDPRSGKQSWVQKTDNNTPPQSLKITDPWGRPYLYRKGTQAQNPDFDLWSRGKDGDTNTSDPSKNADENRDDVRNF